MAAFGSCWLCAVRVEAPVALRPEGERDGRLVCRGCGRRFVEHLRRLGAQGAPLLDPRIFRPQPAAGERAGCQGAFLERVREALAAEDDRTRAHVATAYLEMDLREEGLLALSTVAPEALLGFSQRTLTSLLTRLFHPAALEAQALDALREAVRLDP